MLRVEAVIPRHFLHLQSMLPLWLHIFDTQPLEEHIGRIKDPADVSRIGTMLATEVIQLFRLQLHIHGTELGSEVLQELRLGHAGLPKMGRDLASDLSAAAADLDLILLLALEVHIRKADGHRLVGLPALLGHGDTLGFTLLEELVRPLHRAATHAVPASVLGRTVRCPLRSRFGTPPPSFLRPRGRC